MRSCAAARPALQDWPPTSIQADRRPRTAPRPETGRRPAGSSPGSPPSALRSCRDRLTVSASLSPSDRRHASVAYLAPPLLHAAARRFGPLPLQHAPGRLPAVASALPVRRDWPDTRSDHRENGDTYSPNGGEAASGVRPHRAVPGPLPSAGRDAAIHRRDPVPRRSILPADELLLPGSHQMRPTTALRAG